MKFLSRNFLVPHIIWSGFILISLVYLVTSLHVVSDVSQFLPETDTNSDAQFLLDELQQGNTSRLLILRMSGSEAETLASISRDLKTRLSENPAIASVNNGEQKQDISRYEILFKYRYLLSAAKDFSSTALKESLQQRLSELRAGLGSIVKNILPADPQHHFVQYLSPLMKRASTTHHLGLWFNPDKTAALLLIELNIHQFDLNAQQQAIEQIQQTVKNVSAGNKVTLDITGAAKMAVSMRTAIQSTTQWLSSIALVLMCLLFWWGYHSARLFFLAALPLGSAVIAALVMTNLVFQQVHGIIIAFGITLLGVCLDYPVHLFSHRSQSQTARQTLKEIWPTLRLGVLTTALAYLAMLGTGFSGLSQLSVFAISGLLVSLFVTRWILPLWLDISPGKTTTVPFHAYLTRLSRMHFSTRHIIFLSSSLVVFCLLTIILNSNHIWSENIADLSPIPQQAKELDKALRYDVGAPDVNHIFMLKDDDAEKLLQRVATLKHDLAPLQQQHIVSGIYSVTDFLPSQKQQRKHQQHLPEKQLLQSQLNIAQQQLPFKQDTFNHFVNDVAQSKNLEPLNATQFLDTELGKHFKSDLFFKDNQWISITRLSGVSDESALTDWLANNPELQQHYLNLRQSTSRLMFDYQQTALKRLLIGTIIITLILFALRSYKQVGRILIPILLATLLSMSLQLLSGTQLTLFHILALLLVLGVGLDYGLFFDRKWTSLHDYQQRLHGIFISAASTLITFGILAFSEIPVLAALGKTVTYGVIACFVLTFIYSEKHTGHP